ncbi:MAG: DUF4276 family protein [Verrucomicrobiota bacterium]|nr:DUF4276 family protein [Verrucomicrobiota bacterium]
MARLLVHVEGQTEETFVNQILAPHLYSLGFFSVSARLVGNARKRDRRGGIRPWNSVRNDIVKHLKEDQECFSTTLIDYYGLPSDWPGRQEASNASFERKADLVESGMRQDISSSLGTNDKPRFLPYVMMHEFEGLLFSNCPAFAKAINREDLTSQFQVIRDQFASPEEINDSPKDAPSKRIKNLVQKYEKPLLGSLAILEIGLQTIRNQCPHFNSWLTKLEGWSLQQS